MAQPEQSPTKRRARSEKMLDQVSTLLSLLAAVTVIGWVAYQWMHRPVPPTIPIPAAPIVLGDAQVRGDSATGLVVIEYSDYECPYCGTFARQDEPKLLHDYVQTGRARFALVNHPLEQMHPHAFRAAEAAICAGRQHRFWEMHDALFADQAHLDDPSLLDRARKLGLDMSAFNACLANQQTATDVRGGISAAEAVHAGGTPTFIVGHIQPDGTVKASAVISGANYGELVSALDGPNWRLRGAAGLGIVAAIAVFVLARRQRARAVRNTPASVAAS